MTTLLNAFYTVTNQHIKGNLLITRLVFNRNHEVYNGHFPQQPVTPGVCILQTAKELIEEHRQRKLCVSNVKHVKFLKLVLPDENKTLQYNITLKTEENGEIKAQFSLKDTHDNVYTKATIKYRDL